MGLMDRIRADVLKITSDATAGFGTPLLFESPFGIQASVVGIAVKHHLKIDDDGRAVNGKTANFSISEYSLNAANYPYRTAAGEVDLKGHKVSWKDSSGVTYSYMISEWYPDAAVGLIYCTLRDFN